MEVSLRICPTWNIERAFFPSTNRTERGYFIPKPGDGAAAPLTNDVFKDNRGLLWVTDKERGLDVIEYKS